MLISPETQGCVAYFYFTGIEATETGYAITFDYMVDGIPVYLSSGDAAMEVVLELV